MEKNTVLNGNKLIAEFLGMDDDIEHKFHSSWDWLIPVIDKIDNGPYEGYAYHEGYHSKIISALSSLSRESTFLWIVAYIEWFNKKNNK